MMDRDRVLIELPYRMQAIATLNLAINLSAALSAAPMKLYAGDKLVVEALCMASPIQPSKPG
jgi:hypothetical protein